MKTQVDHLIEVGRPIEVYSTYTLERFELVVPTFSSETCFQGITITPSAKWGPHIVYPFRHVKRIAFGNPKLHKDLIPADESPTPIPPMESMEQALRWCCEGRRRVKVFDVTDHEETFGRITEVEGDIFTIKDRNGKNGYSEFRRIVDCSKLRIAL